ncbi:MAG: ankyrin repeat domain-containing protein [Blautia producta]
MSRKLNERLMNAVKNNQREEVKFLLNAGADVNAKDVYGSTPLHFATNYARSHIMELLVEYGADVNAQDKNGITKLMQVCSYGDIEMAGYLLEHGANPMITDLLDENSMDYAKRVMYADSQFQEKPVVTYKKLRTMLIKHATREKGMDISYPYLSRNCRKSKKHIQMQPLK